MSILNSYKIYRGTETTISENGSPDGVIIAANINTAHMACLLKVFNTFLDNTPKPDKAATIVGNSKTIPKVSTIEVNIDMYEVNENVFSTSGLT